MADVALTIIGEDRPGLVSALATVVAIHGGNWQQSQLTRLAGQFAGVVLVDLPEDRLAAFDEALNGVRSGGVTVVAVNTNAVPAEGELMRLSLVGDDRPGIVAQISRVMAGLGVTIDSLDTYTSEAPLAGGLLFHAEAILRLPPGVEADAIRAGIEPIAGELMIDLDVVSA